MSDETPILRVPDGSTFDAGGREVPAYQYVSLRYEAVENPAASAREGRKIFDRVLYVRSHFLGSSDTLDREAMRWRGGEGEPEISDEALVARFATAIEAFRKNVAAAEAGTPLAVLNLDVAREAELRALAVTTVEALAEVPDGQLRKLGAEARALRDRAVRFLSASSDNAPLLKAEAEAKAHREEAAALRDEVAALRAELAAARALHAPAKAKRGEIT